MTRRRTLLACTALVMSLGVAAHAVAQAEAERRLDAALARLRAALPPGSALEWRDRTVDPVTGAARLTGVTIREGATQLTAEEVTLRDLDDTRIGAATLRAVRLTGPARASSANTPAAPPGGSKDAPAAAPGAIGTMTLAQASLTNLRLPSAAGVPSGQGAVNWAEAAVDAATMEGMTFEAQDPGSVTLGRLTLSNYAPGRVGEATLEGLRFTENPAKGQGRMALGRVRIANAAVPRIGQPVDPWAIAADAALLEGVELDLPGDRITFRLGRMEVQGWGEGRTTRAAIAGAAFAGPGNDKVGDFDLRAGRFEFSGVALHDIARATSQGQSPPRGEPTQPVNGVAEGLAASFGGRQVVAIGGMRFDAGPVPNDPQAQAGTLTVAGISIDLPPESGGAQLAALGYRNLTGRIDVASRGSEAARTLVADPFAITVDGMGRLEFQMDIRNWSNPPAGASVSDAGDALARMAEWEIAAFVIRYADTGLLPRLFAQQAREARVPEARLRDQYAQMAQQMPLPEGRDPNATRAIRQAVASFIRNPGTIEIAMRPPRPVAFAALMGVSTAPSGDLVAQLGLSARALPPAGAAGPQPAVTRPAPAPVPPAPVAPAQAAPGKPPPAGVAAPVAPARPAPVQPAPRPAPAPSGAPLGKPPAL